MIDEYLGKENVITLIKEIKRNPKYNEKNNSSNNIYSNIMGPELSLYILYDALIKYKIIINDNSLFDNYIIQLDKIYKKIDDISQVIVGINKLICYMTSKLLNIDKIDDEDNQRTIIEYIYSRYIVDGYYVHGFSTVYENSIRDNGFVPEIYINYYKQLCEVNKIFEKYKIENIMQKDFTSNKTYFTDDFIMGCYYSSMAPGFFTNILFSEVYGKKIDKDSYLKLDYNKSIKYLKKYMINNSFNSDDMRYILYIVEKEWKLLHRVKKKISLLLIKRSNVSSINNNVDDYIDKDSDLYENVDRILNPKNSNIGFTDTLNPRQFMIVSLNGFYDIDINLFNTINLGKLDLSSYKKDNEQVNKDFLDAYGKVYIFLVIGSLLISLGVIITIIMIIRGI